MALGRLLLLCLVASEVWDAVTNPAAFVCNKSARRALNIVAEVRRAWINCNGSSTLSTPVQLPCVELHVASWGNKSQQEKRGDIVASLRLLAEGVEAAKGLSQPGCATTLLQSLEKNINNYLLILGNLQLIQEAAMSSTLSCVPQSTHSLSTVLLHYNDLISGKLERFMDDIKDICP